MKNETSSDISYAMRWRPDFRYTSNKHIEVSLNNFKSSEPSVTDKEAYRVTLASLRGELARGSGKIDVGSYSLKAGEEYDPSKDFSFLNRKDLTIVELDEWIAHYKKMCEDYDESLTQDIQKQLAKAEKLRENLEKETVNKNTDIKE